MPFHVAGMSFSALSTRYGLSKTHIRRIFARAETQGWISREQAPGRKRNLQVSVTFIEDYMGWQAIKLCALDQAFSLALAQTAAPAPIQRMRQLEPEN